MAIRRSQRGLKERGRFNTPAGPTGYSATRTGAGTDGDPAVVTYSSTASRDGSVTAQAQVTKTSTGVALSGHAVTVAVSTSDTATALASAINSAFGALTTPELTVSSAAGAVTYTPSAGHTVAVATSL